MEAGPWWKPRPLAHDHAPRRGRAPPSPVVRPPMAAGRGGAEEGGETVNSQRSGDWLRRRPALIGQSAGAGWDWLISRAAVTGRRWRLCRVLSTVRGGGGREGAPRGVRVCRGVAGDSRSRSDRFPTSPPCRVPLLPEDGRPRWA